MAYSPHLKHIDQEMKSGAVLDEFDVLDKNWLALTSVENRLLV